MQTFAQVRLKDEVPQPPANLADTMTAVYSYGDLEDWLPRLEALLRAGDDDTVDELGRAWAEFRQSYLKEYRLGVAGAIAAMVETVHHIADLPVFIPILERISSEHAEIEPGELPALIEELSVVREELVSKADYAGWGLIGTRRGRREPVGYGMRPFENEVIAAAEGWRVVLRRDSDAVLVHPLRGEMPISGWSLRRESDGQLPEAEDQGSVLIKLNEGGAISAPSTLGRRLLQLSGGSVEVEIQRSLLVSVYAKVWSGLNEASHLGVEAGYPVWIRRREPGGRLGEILVDLD